MNSNARQLAAIMRDAFTMHGLNISDAVVAKAAEQIAKATPSSTDLPSRIQRPGRTVNHYASPGRPRQPHWYET